MSPLPSPTSEPSPGASQTPPDDYDSPWKEISGRFFPDLVEFFAPDLYADIDWPAGHEILEVLREALQVQAAPHPPDVRLQDGEALGV